MMFSKVDYIKVNVSDMSRSVAFYRDILGLPVSELIVWDANTGRELNSLQGHKAEISGIAFSPDGKRLVSSSRDYTIRVWDIQTGEQIHCLRGHAAEVNCFACSSDGQRLVSAGEDGKIKMWDMNTPPATDRRWPSPMTKR